MNALRHPHTQGPNLNRFIGISLAAHVAVLIFLSVTLSHSVRVSPPQAIQVKLIGVPQPAASAKKVEEVKQVRTQDSAAPKEPPPEMKDIPESKATTKFMDQKPEVAKEELPNPIEAQKRPPVLDKNPQKKKVVKNDLSAEVVKNPEDFLKALEFVDTLEKSQAKPTPNTQATEAPAGDGPELQLNLADSGLISAIQGHISKNWVVPPGLDVRGLSITVLVSLDAQGNLTSLRVSRSSGQTFFDNSLERAIRKSIPLPIPADKIPAFREMELTFSPPPK